MHSNVKTGLKQWFLWTSSFYFSCVFISLVFQEGIWIQFQYSFHEVLWYQLFQFEKFNSSFQQTGCCYMLMCYHSFMVWFLICYILSIAETQKVYTEMQRLQKQSYIDLGGFAYSSYLFNVEKGHRGLVLELDHAFSIFQTAEWVHADIFSLWISVQEQTKCRSHSGSHVCHPVGFGKDYSFLAQGRDEFKT